MKASFLIIIFMIPFNMFSQKKCSKDIQLAAENGQLELVKEMINDGQHINCLGEWQQTLLMIAIQNGKKDVAHYLLEQNADIKKIDESQSDALFKTSFYGLTNIAENLIDKGAKIDNRGYRQMTTLMMAANRNQFDLVKLLVEKGANVNLQCDSGYTALTYTTSPKILTYLLSKNADIYLKSFQGMTALEQFRASLEDVKGYGSKEIINNHYEIIEILEKKY
ncbi:ankyrin repeat domain-containing protein [Psychroserpens sp. MEBiC05023]